MSVSYRGAVRSSESWQTSAGRGLSSHQSLNDILDPLGSCQLQEHIFQPRPWKASLFSQLLCSAFGQNTPVLENGKTITNRLGNLQYVSAENRRDALSSKAVNQLLDHPG